MSGTKAAGRGVRWLACTWILGAAYLAGRGRAHAQSGDADAIALLDKTGIKGGLALVIGTRAPSLAVALAAKSTLYVQILQPDARLAAQWGSAVAVADYREQVGVRQAAFDHEHYGSNLFNLIVVEDSAALAKTKLADLCRILVPNGCLALKSTPEGFSSEAGNLKLNTLSAGGFPAVFRKPVLPPPEWKVCDSVKWKAGAGGTGECAEIVVKDGTLAYADRFENEGNLTVLAGQYIVRDAYNGRTLSSEPLGARKPDWYAPQVAKALSPIKPTPAAPGRNGGRGADGRP